jgi:hypothetical protein
MQGQGEQGIDFLCQRLKGPGSNLHRPYAYLLFADACGKFNRIGIEPSDFYTLDKVPARCDNSHLSIYGTSPECAFYNDFDNSQISLFGTPSDWSQESSHL